MERKVRVRFAPSPTGPLHIGGVRTALYNYLFARRHGGDFLLRIEDTDSQRFVEGAEDYVINALEWCGIKVDEGVKEGGPHAPYRQSQRKDIYFKYATDLVESGNAYYAFDTPDQLQKLRNTSEASGSIFAYNYQIRELLDTSLNLSPEHVQEKIDSGEQWVIRFKMPANEDVEMDDLIRGQVVVNTSTLDDKVLFKSVDMLPTYHLANIVDDYLMDISHVIRGEEWLPSLPLHYLLYRSFGWEGAKPQFAHLPLLLKPTGKGKLSKRDGDKMGFPVFPLEWLSPETGETSRGYREDGYFPESFINMLALLGWNSGTEQEIFSMQELIDNFSLEKVGKSGARFDPEKAKWFNAQYMHHYDDDKLAELFEAQLLEHNIKADIVKRKKIIGLIKERAVFPSDFWDLSSFFFVAPATYDAKVVDKLWKGENPARVAQAKELLSAQNDFSAAAIDKLIHEWIAEKGYQMGQIMNSLRLALVGESKGPAVFEIMEVIGKEETISRLDSAIEGIK